MGPESSVHRSYTTRAEHTRYCKRLKLANKRSIYCWRNIHILLQHRYILRWMWQLEQYKKYSENIEQISSTLHQGLTKVKTSPERHHKTEWFPWRKCSNERSTLASKRWSDKNGKHRVRVQVNHQKTTAKNFKKRQKSPTWWHNWNQETRKSSNLWKEKNTGQQSYRNMRKTERRKTRLWQGRLLMDPWIPIDPYTQYQNIQEWQKQARPQGWLKQE